MCTMWPSDEEKILWWERCFYMIQIGDPPTYTSYTECTKAAYIPYRQRQITWWKCLILMYVWLYMYMGWYVQGICLGMLVHSNNDAMITNDAMSNN